MEWTPTTRVTEIPFYVQSKFQRLLRYIALIDWLRRTATDAQELRLRLKRRSWLTVRSEPWRSSATPAPLAAEPPLLRWNETTSLPHSHRKTSPMTTTAAIAIPEIESALYSQISTLCTPKKPGLTHIIRRSRFSSSFSSFSLACFHFLRFSIDW